MKCPCEPGLRQGHAENRAMDKFIYPGGIQDLNRIRRLLQQWQSSLAEASSSLDVRPRKVEEACNDMQALPNHKPRYVFRNIAPAIWTQSPPQSPHPRCNQSVRGPRRVCQLHVQVTVCLYKCPLIRTNLFSLSSDPVLEHAWAPPTATPSANQHIEARALGSPSSFLIKHEPEASFKAPGRRLLGLPPAAHGGPSPNARPAQNRGR